MSLLSNFGKVFESIIHNRVSNFADSREKIKSINQSFRFRNPKGKKHSTIHVVNKLTSDICWLAVACLIDLEKLRHRLDALIYKLYKKGFPQQLIHMIFNMISCRKFRVEQGKISTKTFSVKNGLQ